MILTQTCETKLRCGHKSTNAATGHRDWQCLGDYIVKERSAHPVSY